MWLLNLDSAGRESVLGDQAQEICRWLEQVANGLARPTRPASLAAESVDTACVRFGPCGPAVVLFIDSWSNISWGVNEGRPHIDDSSVLRVSGYEELLNPTASRRWRDALIDAGYRSSKPFLQNVWDEAGKVGEAVGGHHSRFLAAASCGELAQAHESDFHFFLSMMPWIRAGHWPGGWDDTLGRLKVL